MTSSFWIGFLTAVLAVILVKAVMYAWFWLDVALMSWCVAHPEADKHNVPPPKGELK